MFYLEQSYDTFLFYEKGKEFPFCYSVREGGTVPDCMKNIHEPIREIRKQERLDVQMLVIDGRIFIVQNLYAGFCAGDIWNIGN